MTEQFVDVPMFDVEPARVITPKRPRVPGGPKWSVLNRTDPVKCDDCSLVLAMAKGAAPPARMAHFRRVAPDRTDLLLCAAHAQTRRDEDGLEPLKVRNA
jgi:hypothetical protein